MQPWIRKYEPKFSKDVKGQDTAVQQLSDYIQNYKQQKRKALVLYGPNGCGKTSSVYAIANELNLEVIEVNASDFRNKDAINTVLGGATQQMSLFSKGKIILVDEIDGLSGTKDRGGIPAVTALLDKSSFPVILTALEPYNKKFSTLRKKATLLQFNELNYLEIYQILKHIAQKESVQFEDLALKALARRAGGDCRAAINDLQILSNQPITSESVNSLSDRYQTVSIKQALTTIFKTTDANLALSAFDNVAEDMDKRIMWLDENLPQEYTDPEDLYNAYNCLSKADVYNGRIRRWQHWRFLVYMSNLITAGIATSKKQKYKTPPNYRDSDRILNLWKLNMKYQKRKAIVQKLAEYTHTSTKTATQDIFPYFHHIIKNNEQMRKELQEELDLDKDEIAWLLR